MLTSYNGWSASARAQDFGGITPLIFKGESFAPGVRSGDVHALFSLLVADLDRLVEPVYAPDWHEADDWGYAFRQNRNANNLSCHASGTAIDYNATRHPNGKRGTFSAAQVATIDHLLTVNYRSLIRWGGSFVGTPDEMHWEVIGTPGQVAELIRVVRELGGAQVPPGAPATLPPAQPAATPWMGLPPVRSRPLSFQNWYNRYPFKPALLPVIRPVSNNFGPQSQAALRKVQTRYGLVADGIDGPLTKKLLWDLGWRG